MTADDDQYNYQYTAINDARIFTIVVALISVLFPLSVVIILIQRYNTLVRGKSLVHYVLMIAIADTMTAVFYAFGFPLSGSRACSVQGFCWLFFARMSWFYTDVLIFQLFYVVVFKSYFLEKRYMHVIVTTLNIVLALTPLSNGTIYGEDDDSKHIPLTLCLMSKGKDNDKAANQWIQYTFNIEVYISFIIIIILSTVIVCYSLNINITKSSNVYIIERIKDSWKIVILYPLALMITWLPSQAYAFYFLSYASQHSQKYPKNGIVILDYLNALNVLYGPLLSLIFYTKTLDARRAWMHNLRGILYVTMNIDIDDRTTCASIMSIDDIRVSELEQNQTSLNNHSTWSRVTKITSSLWKRDDDNKLTDKRTTFSINNVELQLNPMSNNNAILRIGEEG